MNDAACISADQTHTLGYFEVQKEDNSSLAICLKEINSELNSIKDIQVDDKKYDIDFLDGGDMVYIANALGINTNFNNAECPCVFCKRPRSTFGDTTKCWGITGEGSRSLSEAFRSYEQGAHGYVNKPVIDFIEFCDYVIDILHLLINVTKKLLELLFNELLRHDNFKTNDSKVLSRLTKVNKLNNMLKSSCKINNAVHSSSKLKSNFELSSAVSAKQYFQVLKTMRFDDFDLAKESKYKIKFIWRKFYDIIIFIKNNNTDHIKLQAETRLFYLSFLDYYHATQVTPYIHITADHLHQLMERHGNLNLFNCEGLEKANSINTRCFHRASNKHANATNSNDHYLAQVLKAKHRLASLTYGTDQANEEQRAKRRREEKENGPSEKTEEEEELQIVDFHSNQTSNDLTFYPLNIHIDSILLDLKRTDWLSNLNIIFAQRIIQAQFGQLNIPEQALHINIRAMTAEDLLDRS